MKKLSLRYKLGLPRWFTLDNFIEMMRYSGDFIIVVKQSEPNYVLLMGHERECEDDDMYSRCSKFFRGQILGRWESFGCEVKEEVESDVYP